MLALTAVLDAPVGTVMVAVSLTDAALATSCTAPGGTPAAEAKACCNGGEARCRHRAERAHGWALAAGRGGRSWGRGRQAEHTRTLVRS